jgi:hypothetical protein
MSKTKKYNTPKKNKKPKRTIKKRTKSTKQGGSMRKEKIVVTLGREHTSPDIVSVISVEKGPTTYDTNSQAEYLVNFISSVSKKFEEELAVMIRGAPTSNTKTKEYEYIFDDSDVALEPGADTPVKCKRKTKNQK